MKNLFRALLIPAAVLCALSVNAHAQTTFNAIGSSALFLEFGEAAYSSNVSSCAWSTGTSSLVVATDTSTGSSLTDTGSAWVVWVPTSGNTCATDATPATVYGYLQTDSVVGDRCLFNATNSSSCTISYTAAAGTAAAGKIEGASEVALPSTVAAALTGHKVNAAGTDIRPEDALFATTRALTPCGSTAGPHGSIAPYLGLGYANGSDILSFYSTAAFHVINFSLPSTYFVQPVGMDPIMVVINTTDPANVGFNDPSGIFNISRTQIAQFLDGSIGTTNGLFPGAPASASKPVTVVVREPLSGTYNTMEYNAPNTMVNMTSQDVGVLQRPNQVNCSGTVPASNPMHITNAVEGSFRNRAIGTGQELTEVFATNDSFGYAFWGVSNFAAAPASARYLQVEGIDPIQNGYTGGAIPTTAAQLSKVTFANLASGLYPIWSLIRVVTVDSATSAIAKNLAIAAANFSTSAHPDFVPYYTIKGATNLLIERSHFAPPGITFNATNQPANGGNAGGVGACTTPEAGGDVGGAIMRIIISDWVYCKDTGTTFGIIGRRN